jgi:hypothetical protein
MEELKGKARLEAVLDRMKEFKRKGDRRRKSCTTNKNME